MFTTNKIKFLPTETKSLDGPSCGPMLTITAVVHHVTVPSAATIRPGPIRCITMRWNWLRVPRDAMQLRPYNMPCHVPRCMPLCKRLFLPLRAYLYGEPSVTLYVLPPSDTQHPRTGPPSRFSGPFSHALLPLP